MESDEGVYLYIQHNLQAAALLHNMGTITHPHLKSWAITATVGSASSALHAQRIGGLHVHNITANGMKIAKRRVYFEASNPKEPIMRVPESLHDEDKVVRTYGWDRSELAHIHNLH